jgi:F-type H+-transporting ATPase subunit epsilon
MAAEQPIEFELVSPARLLVSEPVDMVVVPGAEGDFGAMYRHSPLISAVRTGVIRIYEGDQVRQRIFVAGGFVEVTPERCTVLAEEAMPVDDIDRAAVEAELTDLREDLGAADDGQKDTVARKIAVREAMLAAAA